MSLLDAQSYSLPEREAMTSYLPNPFSPPPG